MTSITKLHRWVKKLGQIRNFSPRLKTLLEGEPDYDFYTSGAFGLHSRTHRLHGAPRVVRPGGAGTPHTVDKRRPENILPLPELTGRGIGPQDEQGLAEGALLGAFGEGYLTLSRPEGKKQRSVTVRLRADA